MTEQEIRQLLDENRTEEAIAALNVLIAEDAANDVYYYLRGNAYRKHNRWREALSDYCKAMDINPDSPAADAYRAAQEILAFYHKDLYNP